MKALILSALLATTALPAMAADMPLKAPPRVAEAASDWTGFYVFGFGGYSWGKITPDAFNVSDLDDRLSNPKPKGGVYGFGGGYLWQTGRWVGGLEIDYGFSQEKDSQTLTIEECIKLLGGYVNTLTVSSKIDSLGSARLRAGYLIMPNLLAYGTAGVGWGRSEVAVSVNVGRNNPADHTLLDAKPNLFGWVAGGGVEWKMFEHLRLRGEYLHYDFGSTSYAFQPLITINAKTTDDVVRGALIWSFN